MSKVLFSSFIVFRYDAIDKEQFHALLPKFSKPELGIQDKVSGFVPCDPEKPGALYLDGGTIARHLVYEHEFHDYNKRRFEQRKKIYLAELESKGEGISSLTGKNKTAKEKEIKEVIQQMMREDKSSNIKVNETPIIISLSRRAPYVFIGIGPKDEKIKKIEKLLTQMGVAGLSMDPPISNGGFDNIAAYTSILKDSAVMNEIKVADPKRPDDPPEITFDVGGTCHLIESAKGSDQEVAKLSHFDLNDRQEVIDLLNQGKDAVSCEFTFKYDEKKYTFIHGYEGNFSKLKRIVDKGEKKTEEAPTPSALLIDAVYVMRVLRDFAIAMTEAI